MLEPEDEQPRRLFERERVAHLGREMHRLHGDAQPTAGHVALVHQVGEHAFDTEPRNGRGELTAQATRVDSVDVPCRIHQRPTSEPRIERETRLDQALVFGAFPRAPRAAHGADGTEADAWSTGIESRERQHDVPRLEICGLAQLGGWQASCLHPEHGQVTARVAPLNRGRHIPAVRERDGDTFVAPDRGVRGDDQSVTPMHARGGDARSSMHRDDAARCMLYRCGQLIGKVHECTASA